MNKDGRGNVDTGMAAHVDVESDASRWVMATKAPRATQVALWKLRWLMVVSLASTASLERTWVTEEGMKFAFGNRACRSVGLGRTLQGRPAPEEGRCNARGAPTGGRKPGMRD